MISVTVRRLLAFAVHAVPAVAAIAVQAQGREAPAPDAACIQRIDVMAADVAQGGPMAE